MSVRPAATPAPAVLPQLAVTPGTAFGIYVHVPFCATRCGYCDFNTYTAGELGGATPDGWLAALRKELALAVASVGARPVDTVFVGGGTPSLLGGSGLAAVLVPGYDAGKALVQRELTSASLDDHGKRFAGLDWRLDASLASHRGALLGAPIVTLTLRYDEVDTDLAVVNLNDRRRLSVGLNLRLSAALVFKHELQFTVNDAGGVGPKGATIKIQFLVRMKGIAEGIDVLGATGLDEKPGKCVRDVFKKKSIGTPSSDPVGVTFTITFAPSGEPRSN